MTPSYRDIYRRHRVLFTLPVLLAAAIAFWAAFTAPKLYRSGATLWSDSAGSGSAVFGALPPAGQDQQLLNELLTTRFFQETVADRSPLAAYLKSHPSDGWGPSALLMKLRGAPTLNERIGTALSPAKVTSNAKGPHVLEVNYDAPSPSLAVQTLRVIIDEFKKQRGALRVDALTSAQTHVTSASNALAAARQKLDGYLGDHPGTSRSDSQLQALAISEREAVTALTNATDNMNQATLAVTNGSSGQTVLRVIDAPQVPLGPTAGKKRLIESVVAGLFAGAILSLLGIAALARRPRREEAVLETAAAADVPVALAEHRLESVE